MANPTEPTAQDRAEQLADDIERFAAFIRANPDVADRMGHQRFLACVAYQGDPRTAMADVIRRAMRAGATVTKNATDKWAGALLKFGQVTLDVYAERDQVCERVVVGTHEETCEEQDPEALAAVPVRAVTKTVEDVRWECTPILAAESAPAECKCGFRAPELGPHPLCPVHGRPTTEPAEGAGAVA
jgi:hypothetical protein